MKLETKALWQFLPGRRVRAQRRTRLQHLVAAGDKANAARDWAAAAAAYEAALDINPALVAIWVQHGHALKEQGFLDKALDAYRKSLALDETCADTYLQIGHVLKLQGRLELAEAAYRNSFFYDSSSPHSRAELESMGVALPHLGTSDADKPAATYRHNAGRGQPAATLKDGLDADFVDEDFILDVYGPNASPSAVRYTSIDHLLKTKGLGDAFLEAFDTTFYYYANDSVREDLGSALPNFPKSLVHFCDVGIDKFLVIAEQASFDPSFYRLTYLDQLPFTPGNAYRHWLTLGVAKGWAPNRAAWVKQFMGRSLAELDQIDIPLVAAMLDLGKGGEKWTAQFEWFADGGAADPRATLRATADTADALAALADRMVVTGREEEGFALYQRIMLQVPDHRPTMMHYADALLRRGDTLEARRLYQRIVDAGGTPSIWVHINLALCLERLGQLLEALGILHGAIQLIPGDQGLRRRFDDLAKKYISRAWDAGIAKSRLGRVRQAQDDLELSCKTVAALVRVEGVLPSRPVRRIAILASLDLAQCRFYRVEQKAEQLRTAGYGVTVYDVRDGVPAFLAELHMHEAAIFYRVPAQYDVITAIERARELGAVTFYEIDDLIFDANEYPSSLASYGGQIDELEYAGLQLGVPLFACAMALCDYGIASTPALAEQMRGRVRTGTVFVHRNAFGQGHEAWAASKPHEHRPGQVTLFYGSGTKAHKEDFQEFVEPALVELVRRHGARISIILMGFISMTEQLRQIEANLTVVAPNWDIDAYWAMLSTVDINMAVLRPSVMTDCKSEIKWLEAAMFAIPSVVSNTDTYVGVIEDGVTGLVCSTPKDWVDALDNLVVDAGLRQRIGDAARDKVRRDYGLDAMAGSLRHIFDAVAPKQERRLPTVLIVNVFYPPQAIGGATRVVHDNVRHLAQNYGTEFNVEVFASIEGGVIPYQLQSYAMDGIRVIGVTTPDVPDIERWTKDEKMGDVFGQVLDHLRPAMVHFHCIQRLTTSIIAVAQVRAIPYVITSHDGWWISDEQFLLNASGALQLYDYREPLATLRMHGQASFDRLMALRRPLAGAAKVLAVSAPFAKLYKACGVENVVTVSNGVSELKAVVRTPSPDGRVRLGFIGGLARHKGYDLIKYALLGNRFGNLRLLAVDHAMQPGTSRREVWGGTEVEFQPKRPQYQVGLLYAEIDVLLAPSVWPESYGLVSREALCAGCWVVASDRGSIGECVSEGQNGFIVDVSGPDKLIDALGEINSNPGLYTTPPSIVPEIKSASSQGDELAAIYKECMIADAGRHEQHPKHSALENAPPAPRSWGQGLGRMFTRVNFLTHDGLAAPELRVETTTECENHRHVKYPDFLR